jgi:phenylpropionate dioxygenase-like ring-hydroxylating dioxygenase large terminal subunit
MLSREDNDILIHTGPGTLMGNLLRRYWLPACLTSEIPAPDSTPIRVRILSEDLVGFRDTQGRVGLIDENCPHRGTSLFFGRNEESGLRCVYHGWKFDIYGNCVEMPSEPESHGFMSKLKVTSYPTHESGGVIWVYLGPADKMPGFRDFGTENLPRDKWRAGYFVQPMNWMQAMEGTIDTTHPSWLHAWKGAADIEDDGSDAPGMYNSGKMQWKFWAYDRAPRVEVVDTWHGWRAAGLRDTPNGNTHARLYQYTFPVTAGPGGGAWVVPVDDTQTRLWQMVTVHTAMKASMVVGGYLGLDFEGWPYDEDGKVRNRENDWLIDREAQKDGTIYTGIRGFFNNQDIMATQTAFTDRTREHLGTLDRKIIRMRRLLLNAAKDLDRGVEPPCLDPSLPYSKIGTPDKVLEPGEDWTVLGSEIDPYMNRLREEWRQGGHDSGKDAAEVAMIIGTGRMSNYLQPRR